MSAHTDDLSTRTPGVTRILVLGGGFGGAYCVQTLEKKLWWRRDLREQIEIVLIDRNNYFAFSPLLVEAGTGGVAPTHAVVGLRRFCRDARFIMAEVTDIDLKAQQVQYQVVGEDSPCTAEYDHLVLSMGTVTFKPPVPGLKEHGFEMKTLVDAIALRDRVIELLEHANAIDDPAKRRELLTLTVVGGSFTGIETAGEFDQYMKRAVKHYPRLSEDDVSVVVINRGDQLFKALDPSLGDYTLRHLRERGIDVKLNTEATVIHANTVELSDGTMLPARTVVWAAGIAPNPSVKYFDVPTDKRGYILCERDLRVKGYDNVWGLGDASYNPDAKGDAYPATAQAAVQQAKICASNLLRVLEDEPTKTADFSDKGQLAAFGHGDAVAQTFGMKITGWPAWFMWRGIYLMKMPGLGRKVRVAVDWTLDLFTRRDYVELGLRRGQRRDREAARDETPQDEPAEAAAA